MHKKSLIIFSSLVLILISFIFAGCFGYAPSTIPGSDKQQQVDIQKPDTADTEAPADTVEEKPAPAYDDDNKSVYVLDTGSKDVLLDHSGNVLLEGKDLEILLNWETKEQFYVIDRRIVAKSGQDPVYTEALYTLDGSMLIDHDSVSYSAVANGFVVCNNVTFSVDGYYGYTGDADRYLLDLTTMKKLKLPDDAGYFTVIWDKYLAYGNYETNSLLIIDFDGYEVFSMENASPVTMPWNDYLLLRYGGDNGEHVMDKDLGIIYSGMEMCLAEMTPQTIIMDDFVISSDGEVLDDYSWIVPYKQQVKYYDDEIAVIAFWDDEGKFNTVLLNRSFDYLNEGVYDYLIKLPYGVGRAEKFVAVRDNEIISIDRDGSISVLNDSKTFLRLEAMPGDKIMCVYINDDDANKSLQWWQMPAGAMILDKNGTVLIDIPPASKPGVRSEIELWGAISNIVGYSGYSYDSENSFCLLVRKYNADRWDMSTIDVYGMDANLIVNNASAIHSVDKDRLLLTHGFSVGMMDLDGNWLYKTSAFDLLEE